MEPVLAADAVSKRYGSTEALDAVSLSVGDGEVLALVGPNGAGKTTFVRVLTGTTEPDGGSASLLGEPPSDVDKQDVGVLPQSFSPPARLTAGELLRYYAGLYDDARDPMAVLESVGVAAAADTRYENLSGGQQRRVCLGSALVNDPAVLVLDEPTTGIDPAGRRTVRRLIEELAASGTTVILTTHDMDEAERIADRVALLADGSLRAVGTPRELIESHGGPPRVHVRLEDAALEAARSALAEAGYDVGSDDDGLVVQDLAPEAIGELVDTLEAGGLDYEGLEWRQPTLEDAYMALAGDEEGSDGTRRGSAATAATGTGGDSS